MECIGSHVSQEVATRLVTEELRRLGLDIIPRPPRLPGQAPLEVASAVWGRWSSEVCTLYFIRAPDYWVARVERSPETAHGRPVLPAALARRLNGAPYIGDFAYYSGKPHTLGAVARAHGEVHGVASESLTEGVSTWHLDTMAAAAAFVSWCARHLRESSPLGLVDVLTQSEEEWSAPEVAQVALDFISQQGLQAELREYVAARMAETPPVDERARAWSPLPEAAVDAAVAWWVALVREQRPDTDEGRLSRFRAGLGARVREALAHRRAAGRPGYVALKIDYEPQDALAEAMLEAGLTTGRAVMDQYLPAQKTMVQLSDRRGVVTAGVGRGASPVQVWPPVAGAQGKG